MISHSQLILFVYASKGNLLGLPTDGAAHAILNLGCCAHIHQTAAPRGDAQIRPNTPRIHAKQNPDSCRSGGEFLCLLFSAGGIEQKKKEEKRARPCLLVALFLALLLLLLVVVWS